MHFLPADLRLSHIAVATPGLALCVSQMHCRGRLEFERGCQIGDPFQRGGGGEKKKMYEEIIPSYARKMQTDARCGDGLFQCWYMSATQQCTFLLYH